MFISLSLLILRVLFFSQKVFKDSGNMFALVWGLLIASNEYPGNKWSTFRPLPHNHFNKEGFRSQRVCKMMVVWFFFYFTLAPILN